MLRRIMLLAALFALAMSAGAQNTLPVRTIPTPFVGATISISPDRIMLAAYENPVLASNEVIPEINLPIILIDIATGDEIGRLEGVQTDLTLSAAFSPDGTKLVSYHINGDLIVWDIATREAEAVYDWLAMGGGAVSYMPDGQTLALTANNGMMGQHLIFDLTVGGITDVLGFRPDTFQQMREVSSNPMSMGVYSVAAQATGPNGEIYGSTANGDVYRWDTETRLRELIYPASDERPLRFNVRSIKVLDDGSVAFLDHGSDSLIIFGPNGMMSRYAVTGRTFALSDDVAVVFDPEAGGLISLDLNDDSSEPQPIVFDTGTDEDGEPVEIGGDLSLAFTNEGDLIVGGLYASEGNSSIYIVDLP